MRTRLLALAAPVVLLTAAIAQAGHGYCQSRTYFGDPGSGPYGPPPIPKLYEYPGAGGGGYQVNPLLRMGHGCGMHGCGMHGCGMHGCGMHGCGGCGFHGGGCGWGGCGLHGCGKPQLAGMNREDAVRYLEGFQYYPPNHILRGPRDFYMFDVKYGIGR